MRDLERAGGPKKPVGAQGRSCASVGGPLLATLGGSTRDLRPPVNMQETLRLLRGLQELDHDLYRVKDELRRLPEELLRRRTKLDLEVAKLNELDHKLHELKGRVKEIEDVTTIQRQRIRKLESEAAGSRGDQALLAAFQHEIRTLRRDISESEEEGLGLVDQQKSLGEERDRLKAAINAAEAEYAGYKKNVDQELSQAKQRGAGLDVERKKRLSGSVAPDIRIQYEKLLDIREGRALAQLEGRICQGCNVSVPNNVYVRLARATELVVCPSCGRILYLPDL